MSKKIRNHTNPSTVTRLNRKTRIRKKLRSHGTETPRLTVYRSNSALYVQIIDDAKAATLVQANTREKEFEKLGSKKNIEAAKSLGQLIGKRALAANLKDVVFDRNGYIYHGKIKAVAEGAREAGLQF